MRDIDPRYRATPPDGFIHWENIVSESPGVTLQERIESMNKLGIPLEDILLSEFVPDDGYNKPMRVIFVRDMHVDKARERDIRLEALMRMLERVSERDEEGYGHGV